MSRTKLPTRRSGKHKAPRRSQGWSDKQWARVDRALESLGLPWATWVKSLQVEELRRLGIK